MDLGLTNKVALVTAASQGLGFAVAKELAQEGASLIICARHKDTIASAAAAIKNSTKAEVLPVAADLCDPADLEHLVTAGVHRFGNIDILVNNTGGPPAGLFENLSRDQWEGATRSMLMSVLDLTRFVLPEMKKNRWGRILNITSIASKQPVDNLILSNSLRAAVTGFAKTLANEVARDGITVNNILPGYTRTERVEQLAVTIAENEGTTPDEARSRWEAEIPMRRLGDPREFAALAAFLVSERASYITGSSIAVDGGWIKSLF